MCAPLVTGHTSIRYSSFSHTRVNPGQHGHYIHSHRLAAEMWTTMENNLLGKKLLSCSYLYRFRKCVSYGCPIINFCNPRVHGSTWSLHTRYRLAAEMWTTMENNLLGKKLLSCSYLYRFRKCVSYGFPIINFCNPRVNYETPCIIFYRKCSNLDIPGSVSVRPPHTHTHTLAQNNNDLPTNCERQ
jgi:hypothetical protein